MKLMSISGAARHLGYKIRSQLYKMIDVGWLVDHLHISMPSGQRFESAWLHFKNKSALDKFFWRLATAAFLMPERLSITIDAQNDAQNFG